nr:hypothetical protein [Enterovibrio nigricans]
MSQHDNGTSPTKTTTTPNSWDDYQDFVSHIPAFIAAFNGEKLRTD